MLVSGKSKLSFFKGFLFLMLSIKPFLFFLPRTFYFYRAVQICKNRYIGLPSPSLGVFFPSHGSDPYLLPDFLYSLSLNPFLGERGFRLLFPFTVGALRLVRRGPVLTPVELEGRSARSSAGLFVSPLRFLNSGRVIYFLRKPFRRLSKSLLPPTVAGKQTLHYIG